MMEESRHRRTFVRAALATALLLPGGLTAMIGAALAQRTPRQGVSRMRGEVLINGRKASSGSAVAPGDTVRTGPKSYATFVVGEDAFLVRGQTEVELGGVERLVNLVRIVTGSLLSVYSKGPERTLRTSTATIGIRGTGAYLEASPQRTYFCVCYGVAELVPVAAPGQTELLRTLHHDQPRFVYPAGRDRVVERAPVINHRDAELVLLESLVGREPPFVDTDEYRSGIRY
jgi:hypothetical protein